MFGCDGEKFSRVVLIVVSRPLGLQNLLGGPRPPPFLLLTCCLYTTVGAFSKEQATVASSSPLLLFRTASIVIGPHGGAEVNAIAMQPLKSCLIEIYPYRMFGHKHVGCYTRMARATNVHFIEMVYQQMGPLSNLSALTDTLAQCQAELLL